MRIFRFELAIIGSKIFSHENTKWASRLEGYKAGKLARSKAFRPASLLASQPLSSDYEL